jgi:mono/diheme cytochrome c family protein
VRTQLALLALALTPMLGCTAALPHASAADAQRVRSTFPDLTVPQLEQGRALYAERCAGCHQLREPASETPLSWPGFVAEMQSDHGVHLTREEEQSILQYLVAVSSR